MFCLREAGVAYGDYIYLRIENTTLIKYIRRCKIVCYENTVRSDTDGYSMLVLTCMCQLTI